MKRLIQILAAFLALPAVLGLAPGAIAQSQASPTVAIGDGAPIPYLDGYESMLVQGAEQIGGITGALTGVEFSMQSTFQTAGEDTPGTWTFALENLVLTDDVLGLFFKQTYSQPIAYRDGTGNAPGAAGLITNILVDGEPLAPVSEFQESYPLDAYAQHSFVLWSLPRPLQDGQVLTFGAAWNEALQAWDGGAAVTLDLTKAADPTLAHQPTVTVQKSIKLWDGSPAVPYNFTVERVAYTPFGNRMLIRFTGIDENSQYMDAILLDDAGNALNILTTMQKFQLNASKEHPAETLNDIWFFGGEDSQSLTLVPLGGNWETSNKADRLASVALDALPADVTLENGTLLHVDSFAMTEGAFFVKYRTDGYAGYVDFDLGDANGDSLKFPFGNYRQDDHSRQLLGYGGIWAETYNGETVSRVSPEQISQVKTLLIRYTVDFPKLIQDEAITVPLSN